MGKEWYTKHDSCRKGFNHVAPAIWHVWYKQHHSNPLQNSTTACAWHYKVLSHPEMTPIACKPVYAAACHIPVTSALTGLELSYMTHLSLQMQRYAHH